MPTAATRSTLPVSTLHLALDLGNTTWKLAVATGHMHAQHHHVGEDEEEGERRCEHRRDLLPTDLREVLEDGGHLGAVSPGPREGDQPAVRRRAVGRARAQALNGPGR